MIKTIFWAFFLIQNCKDRYLDRVLESEDLAGYFLVVKVNIQKKEEEIIVLNYDLYKLMKTRDSAFNNIRSYRDYVKNKILHNEAIDINSNELIQLQAAIVKENRKVLAISSKDIFFDKFFYVSRKYNYARLSPKVKPNERASVIKRLFEWNFFIKSVEGDYQIPELNFCDNYSVDGESKSK